MGECCHICERVTFGTVVPLAFGHWRHDSCALGSEEWKLYYLRQPLKAKGTLKEFYNLFNHVYEVK